jgi:uncharacterized protein YecE (DUF72 family)
MDSAQAIRPVSATPRYRTGTASWTDPTLLAANYYPPTAKTAETRLRFYASQFDTVEVDSTFYALPSERNAALWVQRTPDDFRFHIKAFAFLTGHGAETRALPTAVRERLPAEKLRERRVQRPPPEVLHLCFEMFRSALSPLREAAKLGCILLQFPPWFTARERNEAYIVFCRRQLPDDGLAIEFRHRSWFNGRTSRTLELLRRHDLTLVCTDAPRAASIPAPPYVTTNATGYVRLHGRNRSTWFRRDVTAAQRFQYLYSDDELHECAARIRSLRGAREVNVLFNNCYADCGVRNATTMRGLLA